MKGVLEWLAIVFGAAVMVFIANLNDDACGFPLPPPDDGKGAVVCIRQGDVTRCTTDQGHVTVCWPVADTIRCLDLKGAKA